MSDISWRLPELLAPAGDWQALQTAVKNGADAVYFGMNQFNARNQAANLSPEQLPEAVAFCHERSARAFLALNTLLRDDELPAALAIASAAWSAGIDALIVQDIGLARLLHHLLPDLPLHGSTQMTLTSEADLRLAADLGLQRVILPRELSINEIAERTRQASVLGLETEVFVHGALCVCYSGQCLMSGLSGGRSGNRGTCAQPCRLHYSLEKPGRQHPAKRPGTESGPGQPLLSPKDQALLANLPALLLSDVTSLKIEGRMRGAAYVGQAVAIYRRALDQLDTWLRQGLSLQTLIDPALTNLDLFSKLKTPGARTSEAESAMSFGPFDSAAAAQSAWQACVQADWPALLLAFNRGGSFTDAYLTQGSRDTFTSGNYPGRFGIEVGTIYRINARQGQLQIMQSVQSTILPARGDVLSVRRQDARQQDQEIASAPIGNITQQGRLLLVRGFHPDNLARLQEGDTVYRMNDGQAENQVLQADQRKTEIDLHLRVIDHGPVLTAIVVRGIFSQQAAQATWYEIADSEPALIQPLLSERVSQQLIRTGGTPFRVRRVICDQLPAVSIAQLNSLRRLVLQRLQTRLQQISSRPAMVWPAILPAASELPPLRKSLASDSRMADKQPARAEMAVFWHQIPAGPADLACGADLYEVPLQGLSNEIIASHILPLKAAEPHCRIYAWIPAAQTGRLSSNIPLQTRQLSAWPIDGLIAAWPAYQMRPFTEQPPAHFGLTADTSANLFNHYSLAAALSGGADTVCPSLELNNQQLTETLLAWPVSGQRLELTVYGRLRLMSSAYCPIGQNRPGCRFCIQNQLLQAGQADAGQAYPLLDRRQSRLLVLTHPQTCHIDLLQADLLHAAAAVAEVADNLLQSGSALPVWRIRLNCLEETADERRLLVEAWRRVMLNLASADRPAALSAVEQITHRIASRLGCRLTEGNTRRGVQ